MPNYYNLTKYADAENIIQVMATTDELMSGMFSLFIVIVVFTFIFIVRNKRENGENINNTLIFSSFISLMMATTLYAANIYYNNILYPGLYMYVPAIILVGCSVVKYYNNR